MEKIQGKIHINSLKCVRIEILSDLTKAHLGWASGSFWKFKNRTFLVTNWHVITGRNYQTDETIHKSGAIPGFLNLEFHTIRKTEIQTFHHDEAIVNEVELYKQIDGEIDSEKPLFHIHPIFGNKIDIAVLDLTAIFKNYPDVNIESYDFSKENQNSSLEIMDEVFITGYPLTSSTTPNKYPIYKNATIASEPDAWDSVPIFYVDGKTKSGMSGSPIVKRKRMQIIPNEVGEGGEVFPEKIECIAIYSGRDRQENDEYQAELGIAWKINECLFPILEHASRQQP